MLKQNKDSLRLKHFEKFTSDVEQYINCLCALYAQNTGEKPLEIDDEDFILNTLINLAIALANNKDELFANERDKYFTMLKRLAFLAGFSHYKHVDIFTKKKSKAKIQKLYEDLVKRNLESFSNMKEKHLRPPVDEKSISDKKLKNYSCSTYVD